jgi:hypothetical protein
MNKVFIAIAFLIIAIVCWIISVFMTAAIYLALDNIESGTKTIASFALWILMLWGIIKVYRNKKGSGQIKTKEANDPALNTTISNSSKVSSKKAVNAQNGSIQEQASDRITKKQIWIIALLIITAGYWFAKGTPNPVLFIAGSYAKEVCLELANENKGKLMFNKNEIKVNDSWIKNGKRVVRLIQKEDDGDLNSTLCIYDLSGMVQIPSIIEQGRWR